MEKRTALPISLQPSNLRPIAYRILSKKHGLNIQTDALQVLTETVGSKFGSEWKGSESLQFLEDIAKVWKIQDRGLFVDGTGLKAVIKELAYKDGGLVSFKATRQDTLVDDPVNVEIGYDELKWNDFFRFINPDRQPNYVFDHQRKQFSLIHTPSSKLTFQTKNAVSYFNRRYHLIRDRLSRNSSFQKPSFSSISSIQKSVSNQINELTLIKNVLGRDGSKFLLFGLLSQDAEGNYILEDSSDYIILNLKQAYKSSDCFYCLGMFVIVEGIYSATTNVSTNSNVISGCFYVNYLGHPPAERREVSLEAYGNLDFMGINRDIEDTHILSSHIFRINKNLRKKLLSMEKENVEHKLLILGSDCFLDNAKFMEGLKKLLTKIEDSIIENSNNAPLALVLMGSFTSRPLTPTDSSTSTISNSEDYKNGFDNLASILSKFKNIVLRTKIVLIPGPHDPWQALYSLGSSNLNILPQFPIPKIFLNRLEKLLPKGNLIIGWNPIRVNYLTQEIVVFKDNLYEKLKRNDIVFESDIQREVEKVEREKEKERISHGKISLDDIDTNQPHVSYKTRQARKMVKALLDQGTLQPFLSNLKIINTACDYALRMEPLPSVVILSDSSFPNVSVTYNGCKFINITRAMGSSRKITYAEYFTSAKQIDFLDLYF